MPNNVTLLSGSAAVAEGDANPSDGGYSRLSSDQPRHFPQIAEAYRIWDRAVNRGSFSAMAALEEAMSTSDFPLHLTAAFERQSLAEYQDIPTSWTAFVDRDTVRDFRKRSFLEFTGGKVGLDRIREGGEYPARTVKESPWDIQVGKYGARFQLTWETLRNDDLGAFRSLPNRLAVAARETEDMSAAALLVSATGGSGGGGRVNPWFSAEHGNPVDNKALTADTLEAAITRLRTKKDGDGRPVVTAAGLTLVVPPALEMTARRILNATELRREVDGVTVIEPNYMRGTVNLVVDPWLDVVWTGAGVHRTWFLVPTPGQSRRALVLGFLTGHEQPELRVKSDQGRRVGGGDIPVEDGSFDDDTHQIRARHVLGAAHMDPVATYASTGPA